MFLIECLIHFGEASAILGSITSYNNSSSSSSVDTNTIAGETTSKADNSDPSTNIDVVGLAVFKDDVLVRRTLFDRNFMSFDDYKRHGRMYYYNS